MKSQLATVALSMLSAHAIAATPMVSYIASPLGGANNAGTVSRIVGDRRTVIYDFCSLETCADGATPLSNVTLMPDGSLIGATSAGGIDPAGWGQNGVIFRLEPASDGTWTERVLYNFCTYYGECAHFGGPSSMFLANPNMLEGVTQSPDGHIGETWRFKLITERGGSSWTSVQRWTK